MAHRYVHGYASTEASRLQDQAATLTDLLHDGTSYAAGERVLEAGCGVGAQTVVLAARSPECELVAVDVAAPSVALARERVRRAGLGNVSFHVADLHALPFAPDSFDHVFVCFVLEHLPDPPASIGALCTVLKPGGSLTVIEGDHGSAYFHPDSAAAREAIAHLVELQRRAGGDANIGRTLYPLLRSCGLLDVQVVPRLVYADAAHAELVDGFSRRTFTAMIEGVRAAALTAALTTPARFDEGIRALHRTTEANGVFCYTFFKAVAHRAG